MTGEADDAVSWNEGGSSLPFSMSCEGVVVSSDILSVRNEGTDESVQAEGRWGRRSSERVGLISTFATTARARTRAAVPIDQVADHRAFMTSLISSFLLTWS